MTKDTDKFQRSTHRVLDAAAAIFYSKGYAGTTMRAVADAAGMRAASIYYHYKSKDELISEVLDTSVRTLRDSVQGALAALPENASGRTKIETAIRTHLSTLIGHGTYTLVSRRVFDQVPEEVRLKNIKIRDEYAKIWNDLIVKAYEDGDFINKGNPTLVRLFIIGALNSAVDWYQNRGLSIDELSEVFSSIVLEGMCAPSTGAPDFQRVRGEHLAAKTA